MDLLRIDLLYLRPGLLAHTIVKQELIQGNRIQKKIDKILLQDKFTCELRKKKNSEIVLFFYSK